MSATEEEKLSLVLRSLGANSLSVHLRARDHLMLRAVQGLPTGLLPHIQEIPKGKGMAGQAWVQRRAISTCNLQQDSTVPLAPRARTVNSQHAIAIPLEESGGEVYAVVGFAFPADIEFTDELLTRCEREAEFLCMTLTER